MDRHFISIDLVVCNSQNSQSQSEIRIYTSHLESCLNYTTERMSQIQSIWNSMLEFCRTNNDDRTKSAVFCGDTNLRDKEISNLGNLPKGIIDCWEFCGSVKELKSTWDPKRNTNAGRLLNRTPNVHTMFRYDRMYIAGKLLEPVDFGLRGIQKVVNHDCHPSDHWAILGSFIFNNLKYRICK